MKKFAVAVVTVLATAALAAGVASGSGGGGTVIAAEFPCGVFDGNGNVFITYNSTLTLYSNQQGAKLKLRCEGDGARAPSLTYFNYDNTGASCGVIYGSTTDWVDKVGYNGNSQLTCTLQLEDGDSINGSASAGAGIG
jgi:hypothetical protein